MKFSVLVQDLSTLPKIPPNVASVLDVAITIILLVYLSKAKANVYSSRVHRVMRQLVILIWEAAVPPCACAIIAVVTYLTMVNENWWDLMFQAILGKLYVISLFVTLNGRATIAENVNSSNDRLTSVAWVTSSPFGQNDVESQYQVSSTAAPVSDGDSGLKAGSPSGSERSKSDIRTLG
ncbi:hypothetical protein EUX98_g5160 [Antrodiella citrinella]|uniref:DUF6534 domain-containing protein n=1 Tax=Antrodiella citrinella TaxID=2447956 RepID=A0A4S4MT73_9APHY|nr:hypothetical protein EUX98_g5160 [Antrodiella citrinella]